MKAIVFAVLAIAYLAIGIAVVGVAHGGAETLFLGALVFVYGYAQWRAAATLTGAWRFTSLLPVWFVGSTIAFFLAMGPRTPLDWWWIVVVSGLVCALALLYLGVHWLLYRFVHMDDRMARATEREEAPR